MGGTPTFGNKPAVSSGGTVTSILAGTGITLTPNPITITGTVALSDTLVTPGTYGDTTHVGQFAVNQQGRLTFAGNVLIAPAASSITGGAALTKTNDTNVTLTLGGTPASALLAATSLTLGWAGQLSIGRGGTGQATALTAFNALSPLTTLGDLLTFDGTNNIRLAGGTTGQILNTLASGAVAWTSLLRWDENTDRLSIGLAVVDLPPEALFTIVEQTNLNAATILLETDNTPGTGTATAGTDSVMELRRQRGSHTAPVNLASGDFLGTLVWSGRGNSATRNVASLEAYATENWTTTYGSQLSIYTTANGATAIAERMRFTSGGNVSVSGGLLVGVLGEPTVQFQVGGASTAIIGVAGTASSLVIGQGTTGTDTATLRLRSGNSGTTAPSAFLNRNGTDLSQWTFDGTNTFFDYTGTLNWRTGIGGTTEASLTAGGAFTAITSVTTPLVIGGTGASGTLQLQSTSNATRGTVNLVDQGLIWTTLSTLSAAKTALSFNNTLTLDNNGSSLTLLDARGTWTATASFLNAHALLLTSPTLTNSGTATLIPGLTVAKNSAVVTAGVSASTHIGTGFLDTLTFNLGAGTWAAGHPAYVAYQANAIGASGINATSTYTAFLASANGGAGTWGTHLGLDVGALTGTNSSAVRSAITAASTRFFLNDTGGAQSKFTGKITTYNNVTTAGQGLPYTVQVVDLTGQTATHNTVALFTPSAAGLYRVIVTLTLTTAGTSSTLGGVKINYHTNEGSTAKAQQVPFWIPTSTTATVASSATNTVGDTLIGAVVISADTTAVTYDVTYTPGSPTVGAYSIHIRVEAL